MHRRSGGGSDPRVAVERLRPLGAPIVFACSDGAVQWWKQGSTKAEWLESISTDRVDSFFRDHRNELSPDAVYRAKTLGRVRKEFQLSFVDLGLMPLIEDEVGEALSNLIERCVSELKSRLAWQTVTDAQGHWLLKSVFWLLSGKILRDKNVPDFEDIEIGDVNDVFSRVVRHYGTEPFVVHSNRTLAALENTALTIDSFSSLALTTTESLAHVYENTLISKETRASLGTHSTPSYLVDYIIGELADWIAEIPEKDRSVFEPACGHAAFLVSAMRLLTQLLPPHKAVPSRRGPYLRKRLHGTERDPFALELARLSLTLTDIPNPDGWDLRTEDVFFGDRLAEQARANTIILANPPFERFGDDELKEYSRSSPPILVKNKACEMLRRMLPELQPGSVFGLVIPQSLLHASFARDMRRELIEEFELREVSLFPDKVFRILRCRVGDFARQAKTARRTVQGNTSLSVASRKAIARIPPRRIMCQVHRLSLSLALTRAISGTCECPTWRKYGSGLGVIPERRTSRRLGKALIFEEGTCPLVYPLTPKRTSPTRSRATSASNAGYSFIDFRGCIG